MADSDHLKRCRENKAGHVIVANDRDMIVATCNACSVSLDKTRKELAYKCDKCLHRFCTGCKDVMDEKGWMDKGVPPKD